MFNYPKKDSGATDRIALCMSQVVLRRWPANEAPGKVVPLPLEGAAVPLLYTGSPGATSWGLPHCCALVSRWCLNAYTLFFLDLEGRLLP